MFKKGQVRPTLLIPQLVAWLSVKERTRQGRRSEPVPKSFISGLQENNLLVYKWLRLLNDGENRKDPIH